MACSVVFPLQGYVGEDGEDKVQNDNNKRKGQMHWTRKCQEAKKTMAMAT